MALVRFVGLVLLAGVVAIFAAVQASTGSVPLEAAQPSTTAVSGLPTPTPLLTSTPTETPVPTPTKTPLPTPTKTPRPTAAKTAPPTPAPAPSPSPAPLTSAATATPEPALPPPPPAPVVQERLDASFAAQVLALVNAERASRGLALLATNGALTRAAERYALLLLNYDSLSHTAGGTDLGSRVAAAGYAGWSIVGEVLWLGRGAFGPADVVAGWLASPAHREIILDGSFSEAGVACSRRGAGGALPDRRCVMDLGG